MRRLQLILSKIPSRVSEILFVPALGTFGSAGTQGDFYGNMFGPKRSGTDAKAVVINPATAHIDANSDCKPQD